MSRQAWKGGSNGNGFPKFGRKAVLWLEHAIRARLTAMAADQSSFVREDDIDGCLYWMLDGEDPMRYVNWVSSDEFRGSGFSHGAWTIDWKAVDGDIAPATRYTRRIRLRDADHARINSLEDWLREDLNGTLGYSGHPGGSDMISDELRLELSNAAKAREKRRPIICCDCREPFVRDRRNARRCPTCRSKDATHKAQERVALLKGVR